MKKLSALFFLSLFLFISITQARKNRPICSSSYGDISNISYPSRLKQDPSGCGDPDFELTCQNNYTMMNYNGELYLVKKISYDKHVIRVADINLANGSCGLPYKPLSMDQLWLDARFRGFIDLNNSGTLNFVRCPNNFGVGVNITVPCLSGNTYRVYVNLTKDIRLYPFEIPKQCRVLSFVPATYENMVQNPSYETVLKMQESGFDMRWSVECRDCLTEGHGCVLKSPDDFVFKCEEEEDYATELLEIYSFLAALSLSALTGLIRFILLPLVVIAFILHKYFSTRKMVDVRGISSQIQLPIPPQGMNKS